MGHETRYPVQALCAMLFTIIIYLKVSRTYISFPVVLYSDAALRNSWENPPITQYIIRNQTALLRADSEKSTQSLAVTEENGIEYR